jgi:hypothetical protein
MFENLPYPQPLPGHRQQSQQRHPLPRTMPSFACCLMQSSYAMFMIFYKARVAKQFSPESEIDLASDSNDRLVEELRQGLQRNIRALSNYSVAFEALDGMRGKPFHFEGEFSLCSESLQLLTFPDEIQGAFQTAFPASV